MIHVEAQKLGIEPVRIESSGAMRLRIDNRISVTQKAASLGDFRKVLQEFGLDLSRATTDINSESQWDMSLLLVKRNGNGFTVPLFDKHGDPYPEAPADQQSASCMHPRGH